jgi:hypothetical protein
MLQISSLIFRVLYFLSHMNCADKFSLLEFESQSNKSYSILFIIQSQITCQNIKNLLSLTLISHKPTKESNYSLPRAEEEIPLCCIGVEVTTKPGQSGNTGTDEFGLK